MGRVAALGVTLIVARPCRAQVRRRLDFAPVIGAYLPTTDSPGLPNYACYALFPSTCDLSNRQNNAAAFGARVTGWLNKRIGLEGSVWYSPSGVTGGEYWGAGHVVASSVRLLVRVAPNARTVSPFVAAGPAWVGRFGDPYKFLTGTKNVGANGGVGVDIRASPRLGLRAELEDYTYCIQLLNFAGGLAGKMQHDRFLSAGISVAPFRMGGSPKPGSSVPASE